VLEAGAGAWRRPHCQDAWRRSEETAARDPIEGARKCFHGRIPTLNAPSSVLACAPLRAVARPPLALSGERSSAVSAQRGFAVGARPSWKLSAGN
jgi:hypothetical protein